MLNRRRFIGGTGGLLAAPALIGTLARASAATDVPLTVSSYRLDRTRALLCARKPELQNPLIFAVDALAPLGILRRR